jgi:hypothetical protein
MTGTSGFDSFVSRIGPLAVKDHARQRTLAAEEAPEFHALSFFHSREEIDSQMIAYLLNPNSQHGQGSLFLTAFLTILGVAYQELRAVVVEIEAPCYSLSNKRRLDILIRFTTGGAESVVVIESKSRFAGDQNNQVHDYLTHLRKAFPNASRRYLYYLKDGNPPSKESIVADEWNAAVTAGICRAVDFRKVISDWLAHCEKRHLPSKINIFLKDFKHFIGLDEEDTVPIASGVREAVVKVIQRAGLDGGAVPSDLEALLALYDLHSEIWENAVHVFLGSLEALLKEQLPNWESHYEVTEWHRRPYFELALWKKVGWTTSPDGTSNLRVIVASEDQDSKEPAYIDIYISRHQSFETEGAVFNDRNVMVIGPKKNDATRQVRLGGIRDLRSAAGVRHLLTPQGTMDLASEIVRFISDHETKMDGCFGVNSK